MYNYRVLFLTFLILSSSLEAMELSKLSSGNLASGMQAATALLTRKGGAKTATPLFVAYSTPLAVDRLKELARQAYPDLAKNPLCSIEVLKNPERVREELKRLGAQEITLTTQDGVTLGADHVERGSDTLVITAPGFRGKRTQMANIVAANPTRDILDFSFRWEDPSYLSLKKWEGIRHCLTPVNSIVLNCKNDVHAALKFAHNQGYRKVVGYGTCYSAALFALAQQQAQAERTPTFTHLHLDSCWPSLRALIDVAAQDPGVLWRAKKTPALIANASRIAWAKAKGMAGLLLPAVNVAQKLGQIYDTPIMFTQSVADRSIRFQDFLKLLESGRTLPTVTVTNKDPHARFDKFDPETFAFLQQMFIEKGPEEVARFLSSLNQ